MNQERLLIDLIEDFDEENTLRSARFRLFVLKKNLMNIRKDIEICMRENTDTKQRMKICQNRINFIDDDIRSMKRLKCELESRIVGFIELVEEIDLLPIVYDPKLELFIDQKIEYYSNHVVRHRAVAEKKRQLHAYIQRLQNILNDLDAELANHHAMVAKYNNWIPELRSKQMEMSENIHEIEDDIVAILEGNSNVSQEINDLIRERFDIMQDILEEKIKTLTQLNGFSGHIQSEYDKHVRAISAINERYRCLQEEINNTMALLEETDIDLQTVEMKYNKVEEQIFGYINIQNKLNLIQKYRAYIDLISTYEKERENAQSLLNSFQEKNLNEVFQLSSLESNYGMLLGEERQMELNVASLINASQ